MSLAVAVLVAAVTLGLLYGLFGLGLGLVLRASGELNLAHGDTLMLATYAGLGTAHLGGTGVLAILTACVVAAVIGALAYLVVYGPLSGRLSGGPGFLPAFGVALIVRNAAELVDPSGSTPVPGLFPGGVTRLVTGYQLPASGWWIVGLALVLPAGLTFAMRRSRTGRQLELVADDAPLARLTGLPVRRVLAVTYAVAGLVGGLAGALYASFFGVLATTLGWQATLAGFVAAVLGGAGRLWGAVFGGLALGSAQSVVAGYLSSTYAPVVVYALLIAALLVLPGRDPIRLPPRKV
ncbi:MAG: branched-chain amino acid ABC transporter permease [Mycobacteriales bacterium]